MRILDLFCGAGGASMGYSRAFPDAQILGVDIVPQPNYPFAFVQMDAMTFPLEGFDLIHASPPCHDHSRATSPDRAVNGPKGTGWMLQATFERFADLEVPWIVENVMGAPMLPGKATFKLCGSSFRLDLQRHRLFSSNLEITGLICNHRWQTPRFRTLDNKRGKLGTLSKVVGVHGDCPSTEEFKLRCAAMGIDWMTNRELTQAIPPAYTEWIGRQVAKMKGWT